MLLGLSTALAAVPVEAEVGTQFPIDFGVGARVHLPARLYAGARVGFLPSANVRAVNAFSNAINAYGEPVAEVIEAALGESLILSADVGWKPFVTDRWTRNVSLQAGYVLATLGGEITQQEALAAAFDLQFAEGTDQGTAYDLGSTLHLLRFEVLVQPALTERLHLDLGVGAAFTVAASARAEQTAGDGDTRLDTATTTAAIEAVLVETFVRYVHTPTVRVGLGWRFGGR